MADVIHRGIGFLSNLNYKHGLRPAAESAFTHSIMSASRPLAIIAGVGPGTGRALALRFSKSYTIVALARKPSNFASIVDEITTGGGNAYGVQADITNPNSITAAFSEIAKKYPNLPTAVAVYNVAAFIHKPFQELTLEDIDLGLDTGVRGAFLFSQQVVPGLLKAAKEKSTEHPPTLLFTGATASVKASACFAGFAIGKWGARALSQSLAKEYGKDGVHVGHVVVDGVIDTPAAEAVLNDVEHGKIDTEGLAETYWHLHTQPRAAFTWEVDVRTCVEKW